MARADLIFYGSLSFLIGVFIAGFTSNGFLGIALGVAVFICFRFVILGLGPRIQNLDSRLRGNDKLLLLFLACMFFGFFYYHFFITWREAERILPAQSEHAFQGEVVAEPRVRTGTMHVALELSNPHRGEIEVLLPGSSPVAYGDTASFEGSIDKPEYSYEDPVAVFPKIIKVDSGGGNSVKRALINFKHQLLAVFGKTLGSETGALMAGITLGDQSGFTKEFRAQMASSGTTHLVALSGYNIAILVLALQQLLYGRVRKRLLGILMVTAIVFFVAMVGGEASIVRAAIMGLLLLLAKQTGREHDMRNALTITAGIMVALDPRILLHDVGFELSFVSLLGIVYLAPAIASWRNIDIREESLFDWKENAILTLSAQLAVLPILVMVFGSASLAGVPANILILAFVPATMALGFLIAFVGLIFFPLAILIAYVAELLLRYEVGIIKLFAAISFPIINPFGGWAVFIVYYGMLIAFIMHIAQSSKSKTAISKAVEISSKK